MDGWMEIELEELNCRVRRKDWEEERSWVE